MTTPRKLTPAPLPGHPGVTVTPMHAPGAPSGYYVVTMAAGAEMAEHAHPQAETIIACGLIEVTVEGHLVLLHQGEALDIPPGVPHAVAGSHVREVRYVSIATPDWGQDAPMLVPASVVEATDRLDIETEWNGLSVIRAAEENASEAELSRARGDLNAAIDDMSVAAAYALRAIAVMTAEREEAGA